MRNPLAMHEDQALFCLLSMKQTMCAVDPAYLQNLIDKLDYIVYVTERWIVYESKERHYNVRDVIIAVIREQVQHGNAMVSWILAQRVLREEDSDLFLVSSCTYSLDVY